MLNPPPSAVMRSRMPSSPMPDLTVGSAAGLAVVIDVDLYVRALIRTGRLLHAKTKRDPRRLRMFRRIGDGFLRDP